MKEKLRQSLDEALAFQKLNDTYRDVVQKMLLENDKLSDELIILLASAFNGIGTVQINLFKVIEIIKERISVFGDENGMEKKLISNIEEEDVDLTDDQMEEESEEYQEDDDCQDEWELDDEVD